MVSMGTVGAIIIGILALNNNFSHRVACAFFISMNKRVEVLARLNLRSTNEKTIRECRNPIPICW